MADSGKCYTCFIEAQSNAPLAAILMLHLRRLLLEFDLLGAPDLHVERGLWVLKRVMSGFKFGYADMALKLDIAAEKAAAGSRNLRRGHRQGRGRAIMQMDENFFRVRFGRLSPKERDYVRAMAGREPGPHRSVAVLLGVRVQALSSYRSWLTDNGMIYSPAHGDMVFSVPLFDRFLKRIVPGWAPPAVGH